MRDPREYIDEIQANLKKLQSQGSVTPTENALFGMIDGLAGLQRLTMERVAALELAAHGRPAEAAKRVQGVVDATRPERPVAPERPATPVVGASESARAHGR